MFELKIHTSNAAFESDVAKEIASVLRRAADDLEAGRDVVYLRDSNGNKVGTFILTED
jgi:hypothetical protein